MAYTATCKVCGKTETGELWMDVQAKQWFPLDVYADGTGETSPETVWEWYCPEHQSIEDMVKG
jgi:hypothetical protein